MTTHYRASDGRSLPIIEMAWPHLSAATAKLDSAGDPARAEELTAMRAELGRRKVAFDLKVDALKIEGFGVAGTIQGYMITVPRTPDHVTAPIIADMLPGPYKTEAAAWMHLIKLWGR